LWRNRLGEKKNEVGKKRERTNRSEKAKRPRIPYSGRFGGAGQATGRANKLDGEVWERKGIGCGGGGWKGRSSENGNGVVVLTAWNSIGYGGIDGRKTKKGGHVKGDLKKVKARAHIGQERRGER